MALRDQLFISAAWVNSDVRFANVAGTPVVSAVDSGTGEGIPDEYGLAFSSVAGGTCTITVTTASPNNPYKGRVVNAVPMDGATLVKNVIPGVTLVISGTTANGNTATVNVGLYAGTFDAFGVTAGTRLAETRHRVFNDGTGAVSAAVASLRTQAIQVKKTGHVFSVLRSFAANADEKVVGGGSNRVTPYVMGLTAVSGVGAAKIATLQMDGVTLAADSVQNLSDSTLSNGAGLKAISPPQMYRIVLAGHPLEGLEFALDAGCASGDIANLMIFNSRYVQIARESGGVADVADWGTDDVVLTQAGQAAGVIQPAGEAFYWSSIVVAPGASNESNPVPAMISIEAQESQAANWMA